MRALDNYSQLFQNFTGRDEDLRGVTRYTNYKVMLYRSNLFTHSIRTAAITSELNKLAGKVYADYDPLKAELIALVHDDAEIYFGDIAAGNKKKMSALQLKEVECKEFEAIEKVARRFPDRLGGYSYRRLLFEAKDYTSLESQVVDYADKYDAMGEAFHEIYAGNREFAINIHNSFGRIDTPIEYYTEYFENFLSKFPGLSRLFSMNSALLKKYKKSKYIDEAKNGKPHTRSSLRASTNNPRYDSWRNSVLSINYPEVIRDLYVQKEHN